MADVNNCVMTGRLTRDAEHKVLPTGTELVTFDIANNTGFGKYEKTLFVTINHWGKSGKGMLPYLTKGKGVAISSGELELQQWVSAKDGSKHEKLVINTSKVDFLPGGSRDAQIESKPQQEAVPYNPEQDDIAF